MFKKWIVFDYFLKTIAVTVAVTVTVAVAVAVAVVNYIFSVAK